MHRRPGMTLPCASPAPAGPGAPSDGTGTGQRGVEAAASRPRAAALARPRLQGLDPRILVILAFLVPVLAASPTTTEQDRVHQQLPAPQGLHASFSGKCPPDKVEIVPRTRTRDIQCQCKSGTYQDKDSPEFCQPCSPRCPAGKVVAKPCTPSNDLECVDPESGTPLWIIAPICIPIVLVLAVICCYCKKKSGILQGFKVSNMKNIRVLFDRSCAPGGSEALDNAHNLASEQNPKREELTGVLVKPRGEEERLLGVAGADGSQMRRKLLVPAKGEDAIESLRLSFDEFSNIVPFKSWNPLMRLLGLTDNEICVATSRACDPQQVLYEMLVTWISIKGQAASVNALLDALERLGERRAMERIQDHLEGQKPLRHVNMLESVKLIETFNERFKDVERKHMELNLLAAPFDVEPADVPGNLPHEVIQLHSEDELKAARSKQPAPEEFKIHPPADWALPSAQMNCGATRH